MYFSNIDIIKGLGIVFVVMLHCGFYPRFFLMFCMAVFIIVSGFCFSEKKVSNISSLTRYTVRKMKGLYLPFVLFNLFLIFSQNVFLQMGIYSSVEIPEYSIMPTANVGISDLIHECIHILTFGTMLTGNLGGVSWFFRTLFFVSTIYAVTSYIASKILPGHNLVFQGVFSLVCFIGGWFCCKNKLALPLRMDIVLSTYILYWLGCLFRFVYDKKLPVTSGSNVVYLSMAAITALILLAIYECIPVTVQIGNNQYHSVVQLLICAMAGWFLLWSLSKLIEQFDAAKRFFQYIGQHSLYIMLLHFLAFKLYTWILIGIAGMDMRQLAVFPYLPVPGLIRIGYIVAGCGVPLIFSSLVDLVRKQNKGIR